MDVAEQVDKGQLADRLAGCLLGTALGDALGLPAEGLSARAVARRFGRIDRYRLLGRSGYVSDDTEQAALIAQSLARHPDDPEACARAFARSLLGWCCRLPWGIGRATLRSCVRIGAGRMPSGVVSAGNGAAMRAPIVGVFFADRPEPRARFGRVLAEVTHRDPRAVEGALYVAELAAACARSPRETPREILQQQARAVVTNAELGQALDRAVEPATRKAGIGDAARACGTSGFIVHTAAFATFGFLRWGDAPMTALSQTIAAGGDTDTIAAILGGWLGALHGVPGLPHELLAQIHDGPFGPTHLRDLAACLARVRNGQDAAVPAYSPTGALLRNLALYPVVLAHGFRRLVPF